MHVNHPGSTWRGFISGYYVILWGLVLCGMSTTAQETAPLPVIQNIGEATVSEIPNTAVFTLKKTYTAASYAEAMQAASSFEPNLRKYLTEVELHFSDLAVQAPTVGGLEDISVTVTAELQVPLMTLASAEEANGHFGKICDKMRALVEKFGCTLQGLRFDTNDRKAILKSAVAGATENAYAAAEAAANALALPIHSVDSVEVLEVKWDTEPDPQKNTVTLRRIACTAKVRVTYTLGN